MKEKRINPMERAMSGALEALEALLLDLWNKKYGVKKGRTVSVHLWSPALADQWKVGVRVAEISEWAPNDMGGHGGSSIMQGEPRGFDLLFAAERFLITFGIPPFRPEGWESDIDEAAEAVDNLRWVFNNPPEENA